ncbi:hypothetical protein FXO38_21086 [Capsicum annuum]|nr:hypothetical protein FXO38_21086 [Capsicum annuum]
MAQKNGFPSDIATLFLGLYATVSLMTIHGLENLTLEEAAPPPHGNALAYVNVSFQADVSLSQNDILINNIQLAFGDYGTKHATRAKKVEEYLNGKILNVHVLYDTRKLVKLTVVPEDGTLHPENRSSLAVNFVFEFLYPFTDVHSSISGGLLGGINDTAADEVSDCLDASDIGSTILLESEAVFADDIPSPLNCLHGAFIYSKKPLASVKAIQLAANIDGVVILSRGANVGTITISEYEPLFANNLTRCAGERIAVVVADSQRPADVAAMTSLVEYDTENIVIASKMTHLY